MFDDIIVKKENSGCSISEVDFIVADPQAKSYLILISNDQGSVVGILPDGTVEVYQKGKEEEAARIFYEALELVFKTNLNAGTKEMSDKLSGYAI